MSYLYLGAVVFGATLLVASLVLGGKDVDHGGGGHDGDAHGHDDGGAGMGWAPITSLRFWVFLFAFGGAVGLALEQMGSSQLVAAGGALGIGWISGALAVAIIRAATKKTVTSQIATTEVVGTTGQLVLPVGPGKPGKVRLELKGRAEDFVATLVEDGAELPTGTSVLIVAEGAAGSLLVTKHEV